MNNSPKLVGVRIYPSGGLICQAVFAYECLTVPKAVRQLLVERKPILVDLNDLAMFSVALATAKEMQKVG